MRDVRSRVRLRVREKLQNREEKKRARLFIQKRKKIQETSGDSKESPLVFLGNPRVSSFISIFLACNCDFSE